MKLTTQTLTPPKHAPTEAANTMTTYVYAQQRVTITITLDTNNNNNLQLYATKTFLKLLEHFEANPTTPITFANLQISTPDPF